MLKTAIAITVLATTAYASVATACDKVDYAEAKTWPTAKLVQAYCHDDHENFERFASKLRGIEGYTREDQNACQQQIALYKRLLEARGWRESKTSCK